MTLHVNIASAQLAQSTNNSLVLELSNKSACSFSPKIYSLAGMSITCSNACLISFCSTKINNPIAKHPAFTVLFIASGKSASYASVSYASAANAPSTQITDSLLPCTKLPTSAGKFGKILGTSLKYSAFNHDGALCCWSDTIATKTVADVNTNASAIGKPLSFTVSGWNRFFIRFPNFMPYSSSLFASSMDRTSARLSSIESSLLSSSSSFEEDEDDA
mmetsp:Transcript_5113/g.15151  ORF Transcript_5113/g.15151 Transcript_5113/m.15151 type:complete len:218 (-) Transcript_5113:186-839(-)